MNKKKAAIVFITGQSNAHAHAQSLAEQDRITLPLKNVFTLDRKENQSFDISDVVWSGFTTQGKNLGESQDDTASFAYYLAKRWQNLIDNGKNLPDLYIVQMSIGGQGIVNGMWNPDLPKCLVAGSLENVNISLYHLAKKIFPLVRKNLSDNGIESQVIGWHWLGSEQDLFDDESEVPQLTNRYDSFFNDMMSFIGCDCPTYLYKIYSKKQCEACRKNENSLDIINSQFIRQCKIHDNFRIVDLAESPLWNEKSDDLGIFCPDLIHYCAETQKWFANHFLDEVFERYENTSKFNGKGDVYAKARPKYADELFLYFKNELNISSESIFADIGSGTGIFTQQLLTNGYKVFAVEPNVDMRRKAEEKLSDNINFISVDGTASDTHLPDSSVDYITTAQAFHWFESDLFKKECLRILKPNGKVMIVYNSRNEKTECNQELAKLNEKYCADFHGFSNGINSEKCEAFFDYKCQLFSVDNSQLYSKEEFVNRELSSSYSLKQDEDKYYEYVEELKSLFDKFSVNDVMKYPISTKAYIGSFSDEYINSKK